MIKYIGSKRMLLREILKSVQALSKSGSVLDLFSGTSRVGHFLKQNGYQVFSNDHNAYAATIARCYVQSDKEDHFDKISDIISYLNSLPGKPGYFTETFCEKSRFFQSKNGARIDVIREEIENMNLSQEEKSIVLVSLLEAADRVDSTVGLQMAYLKSWAKRSFNDLELKMPNILSKASSGKGCAFQLDALQAAKSISADICYIDPPYNQHKYVSNYHIWETLVLWDKPEVYGVACKRIDCKTRTSPFNSKKLCQQAFKDIILNLQSKNVVVSFNDEGFLSKNDIQNILSERFKTEVQEIDFNRHVCSKIGIYNPDGEKVGKVTHTKNKEYLFVGYS